MFFSQVLRGISDTLVANGYSLVIADTAQRSRARARVRGLHSGGRVDGVLLLNGRSLLTGRKGHASTMPTVSLCERIPGSRFPHVETANREAARAMTAHLVSLGHRRIGYLRGPPTNVLEHDRFAGYRDALREAGLKYEPQLVTIRRFHTGVRRGCRDGLSAASRLPDAIFACNDAMAMGLIRGLTAADIVVPRDVSIAGFDDIEFAAAYNPPLTTVRQSRRDIGERAADLLLRTH